MLVPIYNHTNHYQPELDACYSKISFMQSSLALPSLAPSKLNCLSESKVLLIPGGRPPTIPKPNERTRLTTFPEDESQRGIMMVYLNIILLYRHGILT